MLSAHYDISGYVLLYKLTKIILHKVIKGKSPALSGVATQYRMQMKEKEKRSVFSQLLAPVTEYQILFPSLNIYHIMYALSIIFNLKEVTGAQGLLQLH